MKEISVEELQDLLKNSFDSSILIDVRGDREHNEGHIPGAKNIPIDSLVDHLEDIKSYDRVFLHCGGGSRSKRACELLEELGVEGAINIKGGFRSWKINFG